MHAEIQNMCVEYYACRVERANLPRQPQRVHHVGELLALGHAVLAPQPQRAAGLIFGPFVKHDCDKWTLREHDCAKWTMWTMPVPSGPCLCQVDHACAK